MALENSKLIQRDFDKNSSFSLEIFSGWKNFPPGNLFSQVFSNRIVRRDIAKKITKRKSWKSMTKKRINPERKRERETEEEERQKRWKYRVWLKSKFLVSALQEDRRGS